MRIAHLRKPTHSRFSAEAEPRAAEIELRVADIEMSKAAAARIIEQFSMEIGKPAFAPPVPLERMEGTKATAFTREELFELLGQGAKVVLQAAPGSGKTVSLLDWALGYGVGDPNRVGVFVRLKEIAVTSDELIAHVARLESTGQVWWAREASELSPQRSDN